MSDSELKEDVAMRYLFIVLSLSILLISGCGGGGGNPIDPDPKGGDLSGLVGSWYIGGFEDGTAEYQAREHEPGSEWQDFLDDYENEWRWDFKIFDDSIGSEFCRVGEWAGDLSDYRLLVPKGTIHEYSYDGITLKIFVEYVAEGETGWGEEWTQTGTHIFTISLIPGQTERPITGTHVAHNDYKDEGFTRDMDITGNFSGTITKK